MQPTSVIDLHWAGHPRSIASALLRSQQHFALVDPGPASTLDTLRQELGRHGLEFSNLDAIFLTHIHLDHAGATGALVRENPRLAVYVHTRGAPHLIDPSKLLQSAGRLYDADMQRLFGDFLPVPQANLRPLEGGETLALGSRLFRVLYAPGHASHHVTYFDPSESIAFIGDNGGICINGHPFILPATPPPDISIELWDATLDALSALHPKRLFLTHFAFSDDPAVHLANFRERLHRWSDLVADILPRYSDNSEAMRHFSKEVAAEAAQFLSPDEVAHYAFNGALHLSWMGLARYHRKRTESAAT